jgi:hypothetical protein
MSSQCGMTFLSHGTLAVERAQGLNRSKPERTHDYRATVLDQMHPQVIEALWISHCPRLFQYHGAKWRTSMMLFGTTKT